MTLWAGQRAIPTMSLVLVGRLFRMNAIAQNEQKLHRSMPSLCGTIWMEPEKRLCGRLTKLGREAMIQGLGVFGYGCHFTKKRPGTAVRNAKSRENPAKQAKATYSFLMESYRPLRYAP